MENTQLLPAAEDEHVLLATAGGTQQPALCEGTSERKQAGSHNLQFVADLVYRAQLLRGSCEHAGDALVVVVWQHTSEALARRLGIVYCYNRPCALHAVRAPPKPPLPVPRQGRDAAPAGGAEASGGAGTTDV